LTVVISKDEPTFRKEAARLFMEAAHFSIKEHGSFAVALAGGQTAQKLYVTLREPYYRDRILWEKIYFFWGDERCVPPDHQESNYKRAYDELFSKLNIPVDHIFRIPSEITPPFEAARTYEKTLKAFFNVSNTPPQFDLIILGVGEDGHTASLFPGSSALKEQEHWVVAIHVDALGSDRITLSYPVINNAKRILALCAGESKAKIVREIFLKDLPQNRYPIQKVKPVSGEITWVFDALAAAKLPPDISAIAIHV